MADGVSIPTTTPRNPDGKEQFTMVGGNRPTTARSFIPLTDVDTTPKHLLGTVAANAEARFPAAGEFKTGDYLFSFADNAAIATGATSPPPIFYAPGDSTVTVAEATGMYAPLGLVLTQLRIRFREGQTHIAIRNPNGSGKTIAVWACREI